MDPTEVPLRWTDEPTHCDSYEKCWQDSFVGLVRGLPVVPAAAVPDIEEFLEEPTSRTVLECECWRRLIRPGPRLIEYFCVSLDLLAKPAGDLEDVRDFPLDCTRSGSRPNALYDCILTQVTELGFVFEK